MAARQRRGGRRDGSVSVGVATAATRRGAGIDVPFSHSLRADMPASAVCAAGLGGGAAAARSAERGGRRLFSYFSLLTTPFARGVGPGFSQKMIPENTWVGLVVPNLSLRGDGRGMGSCRIATNTHERNAKIDSRRCSALAPAKFSTRNALVSGAVPTNGAAVSDSFLLFFCPSGGLHSRRVIGGDRLPNWGLPSRASAQRRNAVVVAAHRGVYTALAHLKYRLAT